MRRSGAPLRALREATVVLAIVGGLAVMRPATASASILGDACSVAGDFNGAAGKACGLLGKLKTVVGGSSSASTASTALGLTAIVAWVLAGAKFSLSETTKILGDATTPQLRTTWFSSTYWHIAGIGALLTLPFLFAAAAQALLHSDPALLARAALGYLPLAMLAVAIAAPLTMLLLAATDQLCAVVSSAAGGDGLQPDLAHAIIAGAIGATALAKGPFLVLLVGVITTAGAIILWLELAVREAAVYVIVLMLPLAFAALVWPARRVWAIRSLELLVALILSKLTIVAVIDLGGAALDQLGHHDVGGITAGLAGTVLVLLAAFSPWAVLRLVPLSELSSSAVGSLRQGTYGAFREGDDLRQAGESKLADVVSRLSAVTGKAADQWQPSSNGSRAPEAEARRRGDQEKIEAGGRSDEEVSGAEWNSSELGDSEPEGAPGEAEDVPNHAEDPGAGADRGETYIPEERTPDLHPSLQSDYYSPSRPLILGPEADYGEAFRSGGDVRDGQAGHDQPVEDHEPLPPQQESGEEIL